MAIAISAKQFFDCLWKGAPEGYNELTLIRPKDNAQDDVQSWFSKFPGEVDEKFLSRATASSGSWNVYFGLGIRSRMRGRDEDVLAVTAFGIDIDFKKTPQEQAVKLLKEFPLKASVGILTGGGIHAYFFLKEAITGDDLKKVKPVVRALSTALGGDLRACTLKQILRVPGSTNIKYTPAPLVQVAVWRPEARYNLGEFEKLFPLAYEETQKPSVRHAENAKHPEPTKELATELLNKVAKLMSEIWVKGYRHHLSLYLSGLLAHAGYSRDSAKKLVQSICIQADDEEASNRNIDVDTTYNQFSIDGPVAGAPSIEKLISTEFPAPVQEKARKVFDLVKRSIPRPPRGGGEGRDRRGPDPDFEIHKIVKFDSRPARFTVQIKMNSDGSILEVSSETDKHVDFRYFRIAFYENNNIFLAPIKQWRWEQMITEASVAGKFELQKAPKEATLKGSVEAELDDFVDSKKENPELGTLRSFPGYNENEVFFRLAAFKSHLKDKKVAVSDRELTHTLKINGWEDTQRRIGQKNPRLWVKTFNGHSKPQQPAVFRE